MNPELQNILDRLTKLEQKALQVQLQPTEKENLKNNLFEGLLTLLPTDATKTYFKVIWKNNPYYIPTGLSVVYWGEVASDGSAIRLPTGWTSATTGTGDYVVTHNLGNASYGVAANAISAYAFGKIPDTSANTFEIIFQDAAGNLANSSFTFILSL